MPIIPFLDDFTIEQSAAEGEIRAARQGRLPDLFRIMLHSPTVSSGWLALGTAIRYHTSLSSAVRETLITFVAQQRGCAHEVTVHAPLAEAAGVPAEALVDLSTWRLSTQLDDAVRTALAIAEPALAGTAPDGTDVAAASAVFGEQGVLEIVALVGYYTAIATFMLGIGLEEPPPR